jgi:hypothetical protein
LHNRFFVIAATATGEQTGEKYSQDQQFFHKPLLDVEMQIKTRPRLRAAGF